LKIPASLANTKKSVDDLKSSLKNIGNVGDLNNEDFTNISKALSGMNNQKIISELTSRKYVDTLRKITETDLAIVLAETGVKDTYSEQAAALIKLLSLKRNNIEMNEEEVALYEKLKDDVNSNDILQGFNENREEGFKTGAQTGMAIASGLFSVLT
jgi:uncharacterized Fe-S center protein